MPKTDHDIKALAELREQQKALTPLEALDQAAEHQGFLAPVPIVVDSGEVFLIVEPRRFNDGQQERWEQLQFDLRQCDREPDIDIPAHKVSDADGNEVFVPSSIVKGAHLIPYQKTLPDGTVEKMTPSYNERLAIVLWGEDGAKRYRDGGGQVVQIGHEWVRIGAEIRQRAESDSKSR